MYNVCFTTHFTMTEMYSYSQGGDGVEYLYIPVDSATLKQFIEEQQNNNVR